MDRSVVRARTRCPAAPDRQACQTGRHDSAPREEPQRCAATLGSCKSVYSCCMPLAPAKSYCGLSGNGTLTSAGVLAGAGTRRKPHRSTSETSRAHNLCRRAGPRQFARSATRERRWPAGNSAPQGPTPAAGRPVAGARPRIVLGAELNERRGLRRLQRPTLQYIRPEGVTFPRDGTFPRADDDVSPRAEMEIRAPQCLPGEATSGGS